MTTSPRAGSAKRLGLAAGVALLLALWLAPVEAVTTLSPPDEPSG